VIFHGLFDFVQIPIAVEIEWPGGLCAAQINPSMTMFMGPVCHSPALVIGLVVMVMGVSTPPSLVLKSIGSQRSLLSLIRASAIGIGREGGFQ